MVKNKRRGKGIGGKRGNNLLGGGRGKDWKKHSWVGRGEDGGAVGFVVNNKGGGWNRGRLLRRKWLGGRIRTFGRKQSLQVGLWEGVGGTR